MEKMLAAIFKGNGILSVEEKDMPQIVETTDVRIKVKAASICGSDLHVLSVPPGQYAKPGTAMGHEYYGVVDEIGEEVTLYKPGDTVVVNNILTCGTCESCRNGMENLCPNAIIYGQTRDGGFAQYCVVPEAQLFPMPKTVKPELAAQTEPLACVLNGMKKINPTPNQKIMLYGAGPIGLTFIRVLKLYGIKDLIVCEMSEKRSEFAKKAGADYVINPSKADLQDEMKNVWGCRADIVIDAVGAGTIFSQAIDLLKEGGTLLIFGQNAKAISSVPPAVITRNELTIKGTYCAHNTFPTSIQFLQDERLELERIISHKFELKDILKAMELLRSQEGARIVIFPNGME